MAEFIKGDVVVIPFPFTDLTRAKRRPALVIAVPDGDDLILCQVTSQAIKDGYAVSISDEDFDEGSLKKQSNVRPNRIFTADRRIVLYKAGHLVEVKVREVVQKLFEIIRGIE